MIKYNFQKNYFILFFETIPWIILTKLLCSLNCILQYLLIKMHQERSYSYYEQATLCLAVFPSPIVLSLSWWQWPCPECFHVLARKWEFNSLIITRIVWPVLRGYHLSRQSRQPWQVFYTEAAEGIRDTLHTKCAQNFKRVGPNWHSRLLFVVVGHLSFCLLRGLRPVISTRIGS